MCSAPLSNIVRSAIRIPHCDCDCIVELTVGCWQFPVALFHHILLEFNNIWSDCAEYPISCCYMLLNEMLRHLREIPFHVLWFF